MNIKNFFFSVISGLMLGLSWPTYGLTFLVFIGFVPILYLEKTNRESSLKLVFFYSYCSFFLWNLVATWWLVYASVFGMLFAVLVNSLLMGIVFTFYSIVARRVDEKLSLIYFITSWIVFEKFHLYWDFSWPWLNLGNVFSENIHWVQWYEYSGSFGGSLWVLIVNFLFLYFLKSYVSTKKLNSTIFSSAVLTVAIPIVISLIIYKKEYKSINTIEVSILQPNIDPYKDKYNQTNISIFKNFKSWVRNDIGTNKLIIAPETYFSESPGYEIDDFTKIEFTKSLKSFLIENNSQLLSGIQFYKLYDSKELKTETSNLIKNNLWIDVYNSSFFMSKQNIPQIYHKSKLVVGVENMPFKKILEPLIGNTLIDLGGSVLSRATQKNREVFFTDQGWKIAPLICYESVYGEYVTEYVRNGAQALAIITNDGWWSESQGYKQHLSYAKLRAVETRKNIIRSANTGSSAVINFRGEIIKKLDYGVKGHINHQLGLNDHQTFYVKYGDFIFRLSLFFFAFILLFTFSKKKNIENSKKNLA